MALAKKRKAPLAGDEARPALPQRCELYLHQQGLDATTPAGNAMFQMLGVFAEFERAIIRERVVAGMARAKGTKSDKPIGRPAIHPARRAAIRAAYETGGVGLRAVAAQFGVGVETVRRCANRLSLPRI